MPGRRAEVEVAADELVDQVEDLQRTLHEERESRARVGAIAGELDLRALLMQHKSAYSAFIVVLEKMAAYSADPHRYSAVRTYASSHLFASILSLGRGYAPPAIARVELELCSPVYFNRLIRTDFVGDGERRWFARYVARRFFGPAVEALWKQLGGADQEQLSS